MSFSFIRTTRRSLILFPALSPKDLNAGESVIVIATASHRVSLEFRLRAIGFHVPDLIREDRYITADAEETLAKFMIDWKVG